MTANERPRSNGAMDIGFHSIAALEAAYLGGALI
jgi:hypothetical protein